MCQLLLKNSKTVILTQQVKITIGSTILVAKRVWQMAKPLLIRVSNVSSTTLEHENIKYSNN